MRTGRAIICSFSDPHVYRIDDGKRIWYFDWSDRFGPSRTNQRGGEISNPYPPERSPFWRCVMLWHFQGKRIERLGDYGPIQTAIWDEPPAGTYVLDDRGVITSFDEPAGFHEQYSELRYVDRGGNPAKPRRSRQSKPKLVITIGSRP